jgi:predicted DNA-binding ribbon-helix-helix protein
MDKNSGDIDWVQLPKEERIRLTKDLYKAVSGVADLKGVTIVRLIDEVFKGLPAVGTDYESNFRRGNISAAKALLMHRWLRCLLQLDEPALLLTIDFLAELGYCGLL